MRIDIGSFIYVYEYICIALLIFNILYMIRSEKGAKKRNKEAAFWKKEIEHQMERLEKGEQVEKQHYRIMEKQLAKTEHLLSYSLALEQLKKEEDRKACLNQYIRSNQIVMQNLAVIYGRKDQMDKAYFASLLAEYPPYVGEEFRPVMETLLGYMEDSTVYCRENVLKACYAMGSPQAVENAFEILNENRWFHHQKLLSDGLMTFQGDKEKLAARLWSFEKKWDENLLCGIVQFITSCSEQYKEIFIEPIQNKNTSQEVRLAMLRYYRKHPYEPVRPFLYDFLKRGKGGENLAIVSASVLASYPGEETVEALKEALHHPNWYVRYNSAASLTDLKVPEEKLLDIIQGNDRYAKEILQYMWEERKR